MSKSIDCLFLSRIFTQRCVFFKLTISNLPIVITPPETVLLQTFYNIFCCADRSWPTIVSLLNLSACILYHTLFVIRFSSVDQFILTPGWLISRLFSSADLWWIEGICLFINSVLEWSQWFRIWHNNSTLFHLNSRFYFHIFIRWIILRIKFEDCENFVESPIPERNSIVRRRTGQNFFQQTAHKNLKVFCSYWIFICLVFHWFFIFHVYFMYNFYIFNLCFDNF